MSKHTPGPWLITQGDEWTDSIHTETEQEGIWTVASVNKRRDEFQANKRLIAAAPELLEALQGMIDSYEHEASYDNPSLLAARAAIAKATGQ